MIDRREMMKLLMVSAMGVAVAAAGSAGPAARVVNEPMRFWIEGDMGAISATAGGQSIQVSGSFAERAAFAIG
jgi:hypothetical protein